MYRFNYHILRSLARHEVSFLRRWLNLSGVELRFPIEAQLLRTKLGSTYISQHTVSPAT